MHPKAPNRKALAELRRINIVDEGGLRCRRYRPALGIDAFRDLVMRLRMGSEPSRYSCVQILAASRKGTALEPFAIAAATLARIRVRSDANLSDRRGATARLLGLARLLQMASRCSPKPASSA